MSYFDYIVIDGETWLTSDAVAERLEMTETAYRVQVYRYKKKMKTPYDFIISRSKKIKQKYYVKSKVVDKFFRQKWRKEDFVYRTLSKIEEWTKKRGRKAVLTILNIDSATYRRLVDNHMLRYESSVELSKKMREFELLKRKEKK